MRAAGVDTAAVVRSLLIAFLEGAMIYGVFHGDLHGGNLFVMPDGRVALFDYGITGRMNEAQRLAFLRMMMTGAVYDMRGQIEAFRDLGALPPDADVDEVLRLLRLDEPVQDPTRMSSEELVREIQRLLKGLLGLGARLPKHLMLYVKGMIFFDGAITKLAPDVNIFEQLTRIYAFFAERHGAKIMQDIGFDPTMAALDPEGIRRSLGLEGDVTTMTQREVNERRAALQRRLESPGDS
jgi:ubiquinone biosynthesis protein